MTDTNDLSQIIIDDQRQQHYDYIPVTLNSYNQDRGLYLPCFPYLKKNYSNFTPLLLANISSSRLSINDLHRRYSTYYDGPFIASIKTNDQESFLYKFFMRFFNDLMKRLKINMTLIDFNLVRLQKIVQRLHTIQKICHRHHFESLCIRNSQQQEQQQQEKLRNDSVELEYSELAVALEFFLQIDVDVFYMKTCQFRGAQPRSLDEGLFCKGDLSSLTHGFQPCQQSNCFLCQQQQQQSQPSYTIQFNKNHMYEFLNGYIAILNCPATCQTTNIIYVLRCPCGEYEFIGSTSSTLYDKIRCVRQYGNQFLHETLLFTSLNNKLQYDFIENCIINQLEQLRLYQHLVRCPIVIQLFLNVNPQYSCFIPIRMEQAIVEDTNYYHNQSSIISPPPLLTPPPPPPPPPPSPHLTPIPFMSSFSTIETAVEYYLQQIPQPPLGYTFSNVQREQQRLFFKHIINTTKVWKSIDLCQATIVAVLPDNVSMLLRKTIELMFSTHAETKLNMMNLCSTNIHQLYGQPYHRSWCEGLIRPPFILPDY